VSVADHSAIIFLIFEILFLSSDLPKRNRFKRLVAQSIILCTLRRLHRDIRIEDRRGRNLRYRAREREVAIRAPVVSFAR